MNTDTNWAGENPEPSAGCFRFAVAAFVVLAVLLVGVQVGKAVASWPTTCC